VQLEAVEGLLMQLDEVRRLLGGLPWVWPDGSRFTRSDFDRFRASLLERGFEWQKAAD
jgi:hypothetical protein